MGFGARCLAFAFLAGFAFYIPFFLRAGAACFAFLDFFAFAFRFFAMISLPIGSTKTLYINSTSRTRKRFLPEPNQHAASGGVKE